MQDNENKQNQGPDNSNGNYGQPVPEPGTYVLLGLGLACLIVYKRESIKIVLRKKLLNY